ncbi:hypothetical protein D3C87_1293410 [compost metagenome]
MPYGYALIDNTLMGLVVRLAIRPSYIQKELGQFQVFLISCNTVKPYQANFYYLMPRIDL